MFPWPPSLRFTTVQCRPTELFSSFVSHVHVVVTRAPPEEEPTNDGEVLRAISEVGEFRNWASTMQTAPAKVFRPTSVEDVKGILQQARQHTAKYSTAIFLHISEKL